MYGKLILTLCLIFLPVFTAMAREGGSEPKELSGMSIVGNDEAPKSLYIVPWKSSDIGAETSLDRMSNEGDVPVDRDVFMRQLDFYEVSAANKTDHKQGG
jgi:hypothetical protein